MIQAKVVQKYEKDIKEKLRNLYEIGIDIEDCIYLLQVAYIHDSIQHLNDSRTKAENIIFNAHKVTNEVAELIFNEPNFQVYEPIPGHFLNIGKSLEELAELIDKKIKKGILFSDKCCGETIFLLQRLIDMMKPTADMIFTRNKILANYVLETEKGVSRRSLEYATSHEEKLIEGICFSEESTIYLKMLDVIKSIAWRSKKIVEKLME